MRARTGSSREIGQARIAGSHGFTLMETLSVAVIVAVLAALSVPVYTGYIREQRRATCKNLAEAGAASANVFLRRNGRWPTPDELNLFLPDPDRFQVEVDMDIPVVRVRDVSVTPNVIDSARFD